MKEVNPKDNKNKDVQTSKKNKNSNLFKKTIDSLFVSPG